MEKNRKLNLGCGKDIKKGYVNLDSVKLPGVDIVMNLNDYPWKLEDNHFDEIICYHVLEHLENFEMSMNELHRILNKNGILKIRVPHFSSAGAWTDPQHKRAFGYFTFDYFVLNKKNDYLSHETVIKFRYIKKRLRFNKKYAIWNWIIELIANLCPHVYEDTPLRIFPAFEIIVELKK